MCAVVQIVRTVPTTVTMGRTLLTLGIMDDRVARVGRYIYRPTLITLSACASA